jgi:sucrose-6-phosphate hydrolase SacC (GH32 family)
MRLPLYLFLFLFCCQANGQNYTQPYRPQFHFSPTSGWIGDPTGAIRFQDTYRLFWWGQATSTDLVYWNDQGWAMTGDNGSFSYFTGSVVADLNNTSGFGTPTDTALVAVYTMHNYATGIQSQGISTSLDYDQFQYYEGNPVIPSNSTDFRDPQVIWDADQQRWVMVITRPLDRTIECYTSPDLINWTYQSTFGGLGARKEVWEVPDLFQLPLNGDPNEMRWVMTCGMGPNRTQYWVGDFDGTHFTPDSIMTNYLQQGSGIPGVLFEDWENGYGDWTATGTAFGSEPATGSFLNQSEVSGFFGDRLVNTFIDGDFPTGTLTSPTFTIEQPFINFLIAGGNYVNSTELQLLIDGTVVRRSQGYNSERLRWDGWDVSEFIGQSASLVILDNASSSWGHINIDNIYFSDVRMATHTEHAYWADWGQDFYAAKSFRDFDGTEGRVVWLAWMNNWTYANSIPTAWGNSTAHSLPRELELVSSPTQGYHLRQRPIPALQILRRDSATLTETLVEGTRTLDEFQPARNTYEIDASFVVEAGSGQDFGLHLCVKGNKKLVLGYDEKASEVYLNRVNANELFLPNFNTEVRVPITRPDSLLRFHLFIDQLSAEVFINDGEEVITSLIFPAADALGIELFAHNHPSALSSLQAWELSSIWGVPPTQTEQIAPAECVDFCYPNPIRSGELLHFREIEGKAIQGVEILSLDGKLLQRLPTDSLSTLPVNLPPGLYLLECQVEDRRYIQKLIVQ